MERSTDEGDGSPARMTIAQAALLYLHGQELRPIHAQPGGVRIGCTAMQGLGNSVSMPDFLSNTHLDISSGGGVGTNELACTRVKSECRRWDRTGRGSLPGIYP